MERDFKFDKRAIKYDGGFEGRLSQKFYRLIYQNIELKPSYNVLDVGRGTGTLLKTLSEIEDINGHGIDIEPNMLKIAKTKCPNMDIKENSCDNINYKDEYFDVLTTCMTYHHFQIKKNLKKKPNAY